MNLRAEHLLKKYKQRTVVNDVSFNVSQGEIVGLLGPNGAGKTTSFYMIVGLIKPNEGTIYLEDENITGDPMYRRAQKGIGYLAQEASVFRKLSVEDNIKAVLEMGNMPRDKQEEKLETLIDEFSLHRVRRNRCRLNSSISVSSFSSCLSRGILPISSTAFILSSTDSLRKTEASCA